jgi:hypothetical protein
VPQEDAKPRFPRTSGLSFATAVLSVKELCHPRVTSPGTRAAAQV